MLKTDRSLFGRIVVVVQIRSLDTSVIVLDHCLGHSLHKKGPLEKQPKQLQKLAAPADGLPNNCNPATVIDGMSLVQ